MDPVSERELGQALCDALGLPAGKLLLGSKIEAQGGFTVLRATFALSAEDIQEIGRRARELAEQREKYST